jgi:hypothetical protein
LENIHPDFIKYKGAEFWKDAALKYLRHNVLGEVEPSQTNFLGEKGKWIIAASFGIACVMLSLWWYEKVTK